MPEQPARNFDGPRLVRKFFYDHPGLQVWLSQIHDSLHASGISMTDSQIRAIVSRAIMEGKMNIEVISRGQSWVYRPVPAGEDRRTPVEVIELAQHQQTLRRFVERMTTKTGRIIIEDVSTGTLYEATELDL